MTAEEILVHAARQAQRLRDEAEDAATQTVADAEARANTLRNQRSWLHPRELAAAEADACGGDGSEQATVAYFSYAPSAYAPSAPEGGREARGPAPAPNRRIRRT